MVRSLEKEGRPYSSREHHGWHHVLDLEHSLEQVLRLGPLLADFRSALDLLSARGTIVILLEPGHETSLAELVTTRHLHNNSVVSLLVEVLDADGT